MGSSAGTASGGILITILPFLLMVFFYLIFAAVGFFILYLIIRAAINNSKLNQNIEQLRIEISRMDTEIKTVQKPSIHLKEPNE